VSRVVGKPRKEKARQVRCENCDSLIEYAPEEIQERNGTDYSGGPDGWKRVKCPAAGCKGHGYIDRW
jgi:hypothetical protein